MCVCEHSRFAWFHANISSPEENALLAQFGNPSEFFFFALHYELVKDKCKSQPIEMVDKYLHLMTSKSANDFTPTENNNSEKKIPMINVFQSF